MFVLILTNYTVGRAELSVGWVYPAAQAANKGLYRLNEAFRALHVADGVADAEGQAFMITTLDLTISGIFALWLTKGIWVSGDVDSITLRGIAESDTGIF